MLHRLLLGQYWITAMLEAFPQNFVIDYLHRMGV